MFAGPVSPITVPSCSASSQKSEDFACGNLFDGSASTSYQSNNEYSGFWVQANFGDEKQSVESVMFEQPENSGEVHIN